MFSQYSHIHGSTTQVFPSTGVAVKQNGVSLNGASWASVVSGSAPTPSVNLLPPPPADVPPTPPSMTELDPKTTSVAQMVTFYSHAYQYYKKQASDQRQVSENLVEGSKEKKENDSRIAWADYYADLSSRCAHYYNNIASKKDEKVIKKEPQPNSSATKKTTTLQKANNGNVSGLSRKSRWGNRNESSSGLSHESNEPPQSFKLYAHRNLARCNSATQRNMMQKELEKKILDSISFCYMHTRNWDKEPLIPVPIGFDFCINKDELSSGNSYVPNPSSTSNSYNDFSFRSNPISHLSSQTSSNNNSITTSKEDSSPFRSNCGIKRKAVTPNKSPNFKTRKIHRKMEEDYDSSLPINNSYYGNATLSEPIDSVATSVEFGTKNVSGNFLPLGSKKKCKNRKMKEAYDSSLPVNDSYYGHVTTSETKDSFATSVEHGTKNVSENFIPLEPKKNSKNLTIKKKVLKNTGFETSASTLANRASRFSSLEGINEPPFSGTRQKDSSNVDRYMGKSLIGGGGSHHGKTKLSDEDYEKMTVKGTCQTLEKEFLRLTSPPRAELVRPKAILAKHLSNIKILWSNRNKSEAGNKIKDYAWFCSQLKAIRQDLTVQRIIDCFSVEVYETHARIALEEGDMNEYNQSQTQLKDLYESLACTETDKLSYASGLENREEFLAYRILYYILLTFNEKYDGGSSDILRIILSLTKNQKLHPAVRHALKVRVSVAENDYHQFFQLRESCPNLGSYLMSKIEPQMRSSGLKCMMKAYRPSVDVNFVLDELGFTGRKIDGMLW
eukprot:CAMPEP_0184855092 /NCGR_PEP_ID=MMETSP0580-20130426/416_1 /TAXON_ID=1118495 /ORGANISM="Dactyliosolen fragilissimus" /LENGTH=783 /DNA_ID=CAMNT_0027349513 /DNA_START=184 /DNA_END=2532 /DNA_ORIENTATION=-